MLSITNLLCNRAAGNESLRYGHVRGDRLGSAKDATNAVPRPVVVWAVTKACNLRCVHCYASASPGPAPGELTDEEGRELLEDLRQFDIPALLFSGGEPLVRPAVLDLIAYANALGHRCTLSTNGLLIDHAMADRLAEAGLKYVGISIDGVPSRHDRLRGRAGAFEGSLAAIDRCRARGIKVGVRFTVHALNADDLDSVFDLCLDHGVERLCVYHLAYAGRGGKMQKVDLTSDQTRAVVERIVQRARGADAAGRSLEVLTVGNHADAADARARRPSPFERRYNPSSRHRREPLRMQHCLDRPAGQRPLRPVQLALSLWELAGAVVQPDLDGCQGCAAFHPARPYPLHATAMSGVPISRCLQWESSLPCRSRDRRLVGGRSRVLPYRCGKSATRQSSCEIDRILPRLPCPLVVSRFGLP